MGLPIHRLILATNENDILSRFFNSGVYSMAGVVPTISPSMDIQVASNFERYLYYRLGEDATVLRELMNAFPQTGRLQVELDEGGRVDDLFRAGRGDTPTTLATIGRYRRDFGYMLDPHTAVGVQVAEQYLSEAFPMICLATAHPAKFTQAIIDATGEEVHHPILDALSDVETRSEYISNNIQAVKRYLEQHIH
jgi:threonine synthase